MTAPTERATAQARLQTSIVKMMTSGMRVAIVGPPKSGKTTLAKTVQDRSGCTLLHGDDYMGLGWSESSQALADAANKADPPLLIEGVQVGRAIRKGMTVDLLIVAKRTYQPLTKEQASMSKGIDTVISGIKSELRGKIVTVEELVVK